MKITESQTNVASLYDNRESPGLDSTWLLDTVELLLCVRSIVYRIVSC